MSEAFEALERLVDALPEAALVLDSAGRVSRANAAARAILALTGGGAVEGRALTELVAFSSEATSVLNELAQAPRVVEVQGEVEGSAARAVAVSLGALPAPARGYVALLRDVGEARRREQVRITHEKLA